PTADHDPGSALNEMRTSDLGSFPNTICTFAYFSHDLACACTLAFCVAEPSRKRQRSFFLFGHFFAEISAIRARRTVGGSSACIGAPLVHPRATMPLASWALSTSPSIPGGTTRSMQVLMCQVGERPRFLLMSVPLRRLVSVTVDPFRPVRNGA